MKRIKNRRGYNSLHNTFIVAIQQTYELFKRLDKETEGIVYTDEIQTLEQALSLAAEIDKIFQDRSYEEFNKVEKEKIKEFYNFVGENIIDWWY